MEQARIDLAAHGRDEDGTGPESIDAPARAKLAVARAAGAMPFIENSDDLIAAEFRALYTAVAPLHGSS
ncbi:MAG: hypothetical protein DLM61_07620 [Pseudonocardiales bacterium]|nr:MAG: hypothetical protein DLM61_07620 [Pseudonocardiales bacterium]